jgi:5,10-methylenetetrahydromethanopterin reductase
VVDKKRGKKEIRFGAHLPIPMATPDRLVRIAKLNEEVGFDSLWIPDHILFIPPGIVPEAWSTLAAVAMVTKKVMLGTCVTDPHRYHPAVLAQKVATVDQLSAGRTILGLGAGESMNLDPFGIRWNKPVSRLIEAVSIIRKLWSGESFSYEGEFWKLKDAFLHIKPAQQRLPIYFGANSPRTLRLTGEMADGWMPTPLSPKLYKKRLKLVEEGAEKAGRAMDEIDSGIYLYTSIADKAEDAYKQLEEVKIMIAHPEILKESGYEIELPEKPGSMAYHRLLPTSEDLGKVSTYAERIPVEAAIEFSVAGTVDECIEKIGEYVKAGAEHMDLINLGPDPRQVMEIYGKEIIPRFKEGR